MQETGEASRSLATHSPAPRPRNPNAPPRRPMPCSPSAQSSAEKPTSPSEQSPGPKVTSPGGKRSGGEAKAQDGSRPRRAGRRSSPRTPGQASESQLQVTTCFAGTAVSLTACSHKQRLLRRVGQRCEETKTDLELPSLSQKAGKRVLFELCCKSVQGSLSVQSSARAWNFRDVRCQVRAPSFLDGRSSWQTRTRLLQRMDLMRALLGLVRV